MRTDLNAGALLYFLGDDVIEGTQSRLTQERGQRSPAGADSRQIQDTAEKESYPPSYGGVNPSYRTRSTFQDDNSSYARVNKNRAPPRFDLITPSLAKVWHVPMTLLLMMTQ